MKLYQISLGLLLLISFPLSGSDVLINEFMASNKDYYQDSFGLYSDWIELYNKSDKDINLKGYYLSDDAKDLKQWEFPEITIEAKSFLVVFCSGENSKNPIELHTNFKISKDGEDLILTYPDGSVADWIEPIEVNEDFTYGRFPDAGELTHLATPTIGVSNNWSGTLLFSHESGFYDEEFDLDIFAGNAVVYYTTDGSTPNKNSEVYSDKIRIRNRNNDTNRISNIRTSPIGEEIWNKDLKWKQPLDKTQKCNVIRVRIEINGQLKENNLVKTYFIGNENKNTKVLSIVTDDSLLFDDNDGIYVPGNKLDPNDIMWTGNYFLKREIPVFAALFDTNKSVIFETNCGFKIQGGSTRARPQKSFTLRAKKIYGQSKFKLNFLGNEKVTNFDNILFRSLFSDGFGTMIKDAVSHNLVRNLNLEHTYTDLSQVYINGEYWGIQDLRNRIDDNYLAELYDIKKDNIEIVNPHNEYNRAFDTIYQYLINNNLNDEKNYNYIKEKIDIDNCIDYYIAELFLRNYDWPAGNILVWRDTTNQYSKWRWIFYDIDAGWVDPEYNMFEHATKNDGSGWPFTDESTLIFRKLLENDEFKANFIQRSLQILNDEFYYNKINSEIQKIKESYKHHISDMTNRWQFPISVEKWENQVSEYLEDFAKNRECNFREHLRDFFDLDFSVLCNNSNVDLIKSTYKIYPQPAEKFLIVELSDQDTINHELIKISDVCGLTQDINYKLDNNNKLQINLEKFAPGVYFLQLNNRYIKFIKK